MEGIKQDRKNSNVVIATRPGMNLDPSILTAKLLNTAHPMLSPPLFIPTGCQRRSPCLTFSQ